MKRMMVFLLLTVLICPVLSAEEQGKSHKWTAILTAVGAGGGFALGTMVGLGAYDDAVNSERKIFTVATISAVAGGVAGFFLGRHMDKQRDLAQFRIMPEIRWPEVQPMAVTSSPSSLLSDTDPIELLSRK